jgi:GlpG protein
MREVGSIDNELDANTFRDFLYNRGIESELETNSLKQWVVWVQDENRLAEAESLLAAFRADPGAADFVRGAEGADKRRADEEKELEAFARKQKTRDDVFGSMAIGSGTLVTLILIAASIIATLLTSGERGAWLQQKLSIAELFNGPLGQGTYYANLLEVSRGEVWRLVTPIFVHFGIIHILFNMMWLLDLGRMIEVRRSSWFLLLFVLVVAVASNTAQFFMSGPSFGGMSGVVYALLGYVWMQSRFNPWSGYVLHSMTVQMMLIWFVLCLTGLVGHIANTTHAVGLVVGVAWGYIDARRAIAKRDV